MVDLDSTHQDEAVAITELTFICGGGILKQRLSRCNNVLAHRVLEAEDGRIVLS